MSNFSGNQQRKDMPFEKKDKRWKHMKNMEDNNMKKMKYYGDTHVGNVREENQDNFRIVEYGEAVCLTVCDGMGGENGGSVASEITVSSFNDYISKEIEENGGLMSSAEKIVNMLSKAISYAHEKVKERARQNEELEGMGTTLVSAFITENGTFVANIGDSRCYSLSSDNFMKITKDHSMVQELIDAGMISEEDAEKHPQKNIITRAIGVDFDMKPDMYFVPFFDYLLLCSDGLTNMVDKDEIKNIVLDKITPKEAVEALILKARENGGLDNITVALIKEEL